MDDVLDLVLPDGAGLRHTKDKTPERQRVLAEHPSSAVRAAVALVDGLVPDVQQRLALDEDEGVVTNLAKNTSLILELFPVLAVHASQGVRFALVGNENLPQKEQVVLASDPDSAVRLRLTFRSVVAAEVLDVLAQDRLTSIRRQAASHPNLVPGTQLLLAKDSEQGVVLSLLKCPSLTREAAIQVSFSTDAFTRDFLADAKVMKWSPDLQARFAKEYYPKRYATLMRAVPADTLESLSSSWEGSAAALRDACLLVHR